MHAPISMRNNMILWKSYILYFAAIAYLPVLSGETTNSPAMNTNLLMTINGLNGSSSSKVSRSTIFLGLVVRGVNPSDSDYFEVSNTV